MHNTGKDKVTLLLVKFALHGKQSSMATTSLRDQAVLELDALYGKPITLPIKQALEEFKEMYRISLRHWMSTREAGGKIHV